MAVAYSAFTQAGLQYQQYPPPLLPKPGKENVRLQKLLKRTAKKKSSAQASQSAAPFRSSLSPVDEASPDLEHSDHSTPPKTPETPHYGVPQHPRFTVRPLYQHVASPYPQRAMYGKRARFSPQTVATPTYPFTQQVLSVSSYHVGASPPQGPATQSTGAKIPVPSSSVSEVTALAGEDKVAAFAESHSGLEPAEMVKPQQKHSRPGPVPFPAPGGQAVTRPLTVLTSYIKPRSPRPTFKATEPSRSPKPMFDVPQIRMYTATTSYYETSRTPPVFDTAELTFIGSTVPPIKTLTETPRGPTPTSEIKRGATPTRQSPLLGADSQRKTGSEAKRGPTPTREMKRPPPTEETSRVVTPTSDVTRRTPTSEIRAKTPTYEFQSSKTSTGRPRTPANYVTRTTRPVFEVSKANPLLFAVRPSTPETETSKPSKPDSAAPLSVEPDFTKTAPNGDVQFDVVPAESPAAKPIQESIRKPESEPERTTEQTPPAQPGPPRPTTPTEPMFPAVSPSAYQRPTTPTYEASRLITAATGYKRPKTPTRGSSPSGASPVAFQRPKTPTQVAHKSKSTYRGLTPVEYAAYGGIKTYSPAFGITPSQTPSLEEPITPKEEPIQSKIPRQDPPVKDKTHLKDDKGPGTPIVPTIVLSQASDVPERMSTPWETKTVSGQPVIQEQRKAGPPTAEVKSAEKQKESITVEDDRKPKSLENSQDPLKVVRKLLGKEKVQSAEKKEGTEKKSEVLDQKEPVTKKMEFVEPPRAEDKEKEEKAKPASAPESKESPPAAEPLLKVPQKPKGAKPKPSAWSRLKKHMVVEQEEPKFPDSAPQKEGRDQDQRQAEKADGKSGAKPDSQEDKQTKDTPKATKMWDAVLFQMFSTKENIMHQIELNKSEEEQKEERTGEIKEVPSFVYRLPVLLFSPRFDAKKLKEAAMRPVTKISTVFEMGLIGRKTKDEEPKDFNRTARGFAAS